MVILLNTFNLEKLILGYNTLSDSQKNTVLDDVTNLLNHPPEIVEEVYSFFSTHVRPCNQFHICPVGAISSLSYYDMFYLQADYFQTLFSHIAAQPEHFKRVFIALQKLSSQQQYGIYTDDTCNLVLRSYFENPIHVSQCLLDLAHANIPLENISIIQKNGFTSRYKLFFCCIISSP